VPIAVRSPRDADLHPSWRKTPNVSALAMSAWSGADGTHHRHGVESAVRSWSTPFAVQPAVSVSQYTALPDRVKNPRRVHSTRWVSMFGVGR
jgi:hypothetical protein